MVYDNTPVLEYLQELYRDQRFDIICNIFNTIEELDKTNLFNKEFKFQDLYLNLSNIISLDEEYTISYISDTITVEITNAIIEYLQYNGIKLDTELRPIIYLFELESIISAFNIVCNLNSDISKELLNNIKNGLQSTEESNIDIVNTFILEEYTNIDESDLYCLIEDVSDSFINKLQLILVESITKDDTTDDIAISKLHKLIDKNNLFSNTIAAKLVYNCNFKNYQAEDNINRLLKSINKNNINMLPFEIVSYLYLSSNFDTIDIDSFINTYLPNETIASLFNLDFETEYNKAILITRDIVDIYNIVRSTQ